MYADRDVFQPFKRAFRIYAVSGVRFFCFLVLSHFCFSLMILFARILAAKNARSAFLLFLLYYDLFVFVKRKENKSLLRAFWEFFTTFLINTNRCSAVIFWRKIHKRRRSDKFVRVRKSKSRTSRIRERWRCWESPAFQGSKRCFCRNDVRDRKSVV